MNYQTKCRLPSYFLVIISILFAFILSTTGCKHDKTEVPQYVLPEYATAIEICTYNLFDSYFNPIVPEGLADDTFKGKTIFLKYVTITKDILENIENNHINIGGWLIVECRNMADVKNYTAGDVVQIVGQCTGFSEDLVAIMMKNCTVFPENYIVSLQQGVEFSSDFY